MNKVQVSLSKIELIAVYLSYAFRYLYPLVLVPYYGRVLGASGYGVVLTGVALANSIWMFVNFGFSTTGSRDIVHTENLDERDPIFREHFTARLLLCIPGALVGLVAVLRSPLLSQVPGAGAFVIAGGVLAAFNLGWFLNSTGRARTSVLIEVFGFLLSLSLIFTFVRKPADIDHVFPVTFVCTIVQLGIAYWIIRREFTGFIAPLHRVISLIKRSTMIFVYGSTSLLLTCASTYILSLLAPASDVSAFGISERLVAAGISIMGPAGQILVPKVMYLVGRNRTQANLMARRIFVVFFTGAIAGVFLTRLLSGWIVPLVFGAEFRYAVPVLDVLVLVLPIAVCTQVIGVYFLIPRKLEKVLARSGIVGALVNVCVAIPLAKYWGAMGMAEARLIGELSLLAMLVFGLWRAGLIHEVLGIEEGFSWQTRLGRWFE